MAGVALLSTDAPAFTPDQARALAAEHYGVEGEARLLTSERDQNFHLTGRDGSERRGAPKVGWCWAGNRHTWLGFASTEG